MDDLIYNNDIIDKDNAIIGASQSYKMISMRANIVFPGVVAHFDLGRDKSLLALERANSEKEKLFLVAQKDAGLVNPTPSDIYSIGVLAKIQQVIKLPNDTVRVLVSGLERMVIDQYISTSPYFEVTLKPFEKLKDDEAELSAIKGAIEEQLTVFQKLDHKIPKENFAILQPVDGERFIANAAQFILETDTERQMLLEMPSLYKQFETIYSKLVSLSEILAVEKRIALKVRESIDKNQKEYYLREQIKAIHNELGDDEEEKEIALKRAEDKKLPEYVMDKIKKELSRMDKMSPSSPEAGVIRAYIDWVLDLPWSEQTDDSVDLEKAKQILDEDHYGLEKVKERILEYLAVHKLSGSLGGPILCFVGPPGVGKTSIVSSIARASGRKFIQMSLGGVRDEAEIRGHRRTYVGSMPGRILSAMKQAEVINPVFLLDEIDKMSSDFRGDPASAMLEVLDPNQNYQFKDHYLEVPYDLSKTMFVCTANSLETIPLPLLDRMEVIELSGYTYEEKLQIAKRYLFPKQMENNGINKSGVKINISDGILNFIISGYTRESGVRNLEREIASVIRKIAVKIVGGDKGEYDLAQKDIEEFLGAPKFKDTQKAEKDTAGLVTGLAWTRVGGVTLNIEAVPIPDGKGEITLTGNMGDVMKESARTALSLVRSRSKEYGISKEMFTSYDLHIHIPEGATPKDGPSAGITLATAILSAMTKRKVKSSVAMTGEITLLGNVLAIGGLKEKSLAALRAGIKTLIIPKENEKDITDIPNEVKDNVKIVLADKIDEVFKVALAE